MRKSSLALVSAGAVNAIGTALTGGDIFSLDISGADLKWIEAMIGPLSDESAAKLLRRAAGIVCHTLKINHEKERQYLDILSDRIYPRIKVALAHGNLGNIFISISNG